MEYRKLGRTGLKVSEISLGSWLTYGNSTEADTATKVIDKAYDLGINSFDTANMYALGEAEKIVGQALSKYPRESFVLATKVFWPMGDGPNDRGLSRKHVFEQLHASLKRLKMDYVDIYYCHRYDPETPVDETLRTIDDMVRQGKVLYVGVSEWTAAQIVEGLGTADRYLLDRIVVNQPQYNMLHRDIEQDVLLTSVKNGISQVVFSPLAQGVLTGKYRRGQALPEGSRATDPSSNMFMSAYLEDNVLEKVEKLIGLAKGLDLSLSQLAIAWILRQPGVASALVGASKPQQIEENAKASGVQLSEDTLNTIEDILQ
ncbi:voltage-dependent potassium channel beta subunit [Pullulanibacillus pueri]|uniref:Aldo/keto reductase n=1 Tax=Pullulanibacillus pueri TaxID=1437324 RepID=A0A8J2ZZ36_9BACL|nr:aldo/keto reductase family protein [Pullulanibacillus pueri]MBM7680982.1 voltage-dependent potassium channel beta subunit [Pullulanibacillus pueri]GGH86216.1 aldo/keto reductase [Pullulanibacillus pueri]